MKLIEVIRETDANSFKSKHGDVIATSILLAQLENEDGELHRFRFDQVGILDTDGKRLVCRLDSQGRMRRDRWLYEMVTSPKQTQTEKDNNKESTMKTTTTKSESKVLKTMKAIKETLKKKDNSKGAHPCMCGCGSNCARYFKQGHDAKLKSAILAFVRDEGPKPAPLAQKVVQEYLSVAPWVTPEIRRAIAN